MVYDVIVIGAGLGGLTAGAKLAKEGRKVLLVEQHDRPGGYATTFQRGDYTLEVGLHEMDGPAPGDMKVKIFNDLGVSSKVEFIHVPEFYRFIHGELAVTLSHDPAVTSGNLSALFPEETEGIRKYFEQLLKDGKTIKMPGQPDISLGNFLDSVIQQEELKLILLGNLGYFHDDPYSLSLTYYSISQGSYYKSGASFIQGGSQQLSDHLAGYIRDHGGKVLLKHQVTNILTQNGVVKGITCHPKNRHSALSQQAFADIIIANNALPNLAEMLPAEYGHRVSEEIREQKTGASLLTIYYGFKKPVKEMGNRHYSTMVFHPSVLSQKDILINNSGDYQQRNFIFTDYSQVESGLAPAGKSVGTICCVDYLKDWEGLTRKAYLRKKREVAGVLTGRLEQLIPGIRENIEYLEVGTPYTCKRYTLNPEGAVYGFAQTPGKKSFDISVLPENLYIASAWGRTGGGFSGAIYGGYLCALSVLRRNRD